MDQNLFMMSMYFFVPVKNPLDDSSLKLLKFKPFLYEKDDFQNIKCSLEYSELEMDVSSKVKLSTPDPKTISLNLYLLHYSHPGLHVSRFFVAIGTSIDKLFDETDFSKPGNQLLAKDIILLKKAFMNNEVYIEDVHVKEWLNNVCENKCLVLYGDYFYNSVTDITSVKESITDKMDMQKLTKLFSDRFYASGNVDEYHHVVDNCNRFAYGILKGDCYYETYTDNEILPFVQSSYYSKVFERTYVNPMGLVFIHTHCPFEKPTEIKELKMSHTIYDVFNIMEYSILFDTQQQLDEFHKDKNDKEVDEIDQRILQIDELLTYKAFNQDETDSKVKVLRKGMGLIEMANHIKSSLTQERRHALNLIKEKQIMTDWKRNKRKKTQTILGFLITNIVAWSIALIKDNIFWGLLCVAVSLVFSVIYVFYIYDPVFYFSIGPDGVPKLGIRPERFEDTTK